MPTVCTACLCPATPAPFVLDGDGFEQCGGVTVVEVLRRTDLGKMHADLPKACLQCGSGRERTLERTLGGRPARDPAPGVF